MYNNDKRTRSEFEGSTVTERNVKRKTELSNAEPNDFSKALDSGYEQSQVNLGKSTLDEDNSNRNSLTADEFITLVATPEQITAVETKLSQAQKELNDVKIFAGYSDIDLQNIIDGIYNRVNAKGGTAGQRAVNVMSELNIYGVSQQTLDMIKEAFKGNSKRWEDWKGSVKPRMLDLLKDRRPRVIAEAQTKFEQVQRELIDIKTPKTVLKSQMKTEQSLSIQRQDADQPLDITALVTEASDYADKIVHRKGNYNVEATYIIEKLHTLYGFNKEQLLSTYITEYEQWYALPNHKKPYDEFNLLKIVTQNIIPKALPITVNKPHRSVLQKFGDPTLKVLNSTSKISGHQPIGVGGTTNSTGDKTVGPLQNPQLFPINSNGKPQGIEGFNYPIKSLAPTVPATPAINPDTSNDLMPTTSQPVLSVINAASDTMTPSTGSYFSSIIPSTIALPKNPPLAVTPYGNSNTSATGYSPSFFSPAPPLSSNVPSENLSNSVLDQSTTAEKPKTASNNVKIPENKAFHITDKNAKDHYFDPKTGQFTKSPIKQVQEKPTPKPTSGTGAGVENILASTNTVVDYLTPIELIPGNPNYTLGVSQHNTASVSSSIEKTPNGWNAKINAGAEAKINIGQFESNTEYYNAQANLNVLSGTANIGINSTPNSLKAEASLFAALGSVKESITTLPKCDGTTCSQLELSAEGHVGAVGAKGSIGIGELKNGKTETSVGGGIGVGLFGAGVKVKQVTWPDPAAEQTNSSATATDNNISKTP